MFDVRTFFKDETGYDEVFVFCKNNHLEYFFDDMWYREYVDPQGNKGGNWWHLEPSAISVSGKAYRCVDQDMDFLHELKMKIYRATRHLDDIEVEDFDVTQKPSWNLLFD